MAHTRAADDFKAIRARMDDLRRERELAAVRQTKRGAVDRAYPTNSDSIVISLCWMRAQLGYRCNRLDKPYGSAAARPATTLGRG